MNQGKRRLNQSLRFVRAAPPTNTGEFGVVALLDERDNLNRPRTSSLELSELLKRWGRGGGLGFGGYGAYGYGGYGYPDAYGYYDDEWWMLPGSSACDDAIRLAHSARSGLQLKRAR